MPDITSSDTPPPDDAVPPSEDTAPPPDDAVPSRRRRWVRVVLVVVVVAVLGFVLITPHISLDEYALSPGTAQPVTPLVSVPPGRAHHVSGDVLLTDVNVSSVTAFNWLANKLSSDTQILPAEELLGPVTPADQLIAQGYLEMAQSQAAAKALALRTLGYRVPERNAGAVLYSVEPSAPAGHAGLSVGQIVTAVNGSPTGTVCAFIGALQPLSAGTTVTLSVEQSVPTSKGVLRPGPVVQRRVRLAKRPRPVATGCPGVGESDSYLGVAAETQLDFTYPFPVHVDTSDIGGPSAGLAMTLGIIAKLSGDDVTGRHTIAATGTIDASGQVGDVGGVAQKTVAVERAGATAFLVPPQELAAAKSKDVPSLRIYAVSTFDQALRVLRSLGGHTPTP